jgi:hypothetical protein
VPVSLSFEFNSDIETGNGSIFHGNIGSIERIYAQALGRFPALQPNIATTKIYIKITGANGYGVYVSNAEGNVRFFPSSYTPGLAMVYGTASITVFAEAF